MNVTELLDHLDALRAKATPGPWNAATAPAEGSDETAADYLVGALRPDEGRPLWVTWAPKVDDVHGDTADYVVPAITGDGPTSRENASFIAGAHAALPKLTAALRAVLAKCDDMEAEAPIGRFFAVEFRRIIDEAVQA